MLPRLLQQLQRGMEIAAVDSEDRGRFFATLVDCHAAAVKAGLRGESVSGLLAATQANTDTEPLFAKLIAEENALEANWKNPAHSGVERIQFTDHGVEIEDLGMRKGPPRDPQVAIAAAEPDTPVPSLAPGNDRHADRMVDFDVTDMPVLEMTRGTWVEFLHDGGRSIRAKLSWISPLKGVYLFTNPGATEALSVAPEALQFQIRRGDAKVIAESSLIDRAVDKMVNSLSLAAHT
jgi:hypothetical protein